MSAETDWIAATGQWASAVATTAAVIVALTVAQRDYRRHLRAQSRQQAEQITAWLLPEQINAHPEEGDPPFLIPTIIQNSSQQLIYEVVAHLVSVQGAFRETAVGDVRPGLMVFAGQVPPGQHQFEMKFLGRGMFLRFGVELAFRDAGGYCWLRRGNGRLEPINKSPLALYDIDPPVPWESP